MDRLELRRQLIHASGVFIAILLREVQAAWGWIVPAAILAVAIGVGYGITYLDRKGIVLPVLTALIRGAERDRDEDFPAKGALRFFMGALLVLLVFRTHSELIAASIIVLALGDSASTLAGVNYGRHKIPYNRAKSIEGTLVGVGAAVIGLLILTPFTFGVALASSAGAMLVESLPLNVDDNLTVPLTAGFVIWALTVGIII